MAALLTCAPLSSTASTITRNDFGRSGRSGRSGSSNESRESASYPYHAAPQDSVYTPREASMNARLSSASIVTATCVLMPAGAAPQFAAAHQPSTASEPQRAAVIPRTQSGQPDLQ